MIPRIIHYCWFGGNPLPKLAKKCIKSWKKYCRGWRIVCWDETNYDFTSAPLYVRQAYEAKKWAFVSDYVRLQVVYEHGGVYLDTDVELVRSLENLLGDQSYFGFEDGVHINTGLGFGAAKGAPILRAMMDDYADIPFVLADGSFDQTTCPERNTKIFLNQGLRQDNTEQLLEGGVHILPSSWLCPIDYYSGCGEIMPHTLSVHHFSASWMPQTMREGRQKRIRQRKKAERKEFWRYLPNRVLLSVLGEENYEKLKSKARRG